jgi:rod shape-determining protein MreC
MKQSKRPSVSIRRQGERSWLPLVLLIVGLLLLVFHESGLLAPVESATHYVLDPLQRLFSGVVEGTGGVFSTVREVRDLRAENEELRAQVDALKVENVRLREYEAEAQQLRALLNFASDYPISTHLGAEVVSREACEDYPCGDTLGGEPNPYLRYVTINVGAQQAAEVGMSVVSGGAGLVGRISEVGPRTAKVRLLTDPDSAVAALLQTTRGTGLLVGQPDGSLQMKYIPQEEEVRVGDIVLTSGLGGLMPKGLVIGQVTAVQQREYETFQTATVRPAVDFRRLELALVITGFEEVPLEEVTSE